MGFGVGEEGEKGRGCWDLYGPEGDARVEPPVRQGLTQK